MIRVPKRIASADSTAELDASDLLELGDERESDAGESDETHQLLAINAETAALALGSGPPRALPDAVPVGQVMASLEAEMSRALSDDKAAWVPRTPSSAPSSLRSLPAAIPSAPRLPVFHEFAHESAAAGQAPASVDVLFDEPDEPDEPDAARDPEPPRAKASEPPPASPPKGARRRPAFAWIVASLALGALGAVVGMRVAKELNARASDNAPASPAASELPAATLGASAVATTTPEPPAPTTPEPPGPPAAAVVTFDERDAVRVGRPRPVAPASPPEAPAAVASATSAGLAPLVPDPPRAAPPPPPPPPKPTRAKTPQEQLLEAQLKASER